MRTMFRLVTAMVVVGVVAGTASAFSWKEQVRVRGSGYEYLGYCVNPAGDIDQDGVPDVAVGGQSDTAYILSGVDGSVIYSLRGMGNGSFGMSIDGAGDVNADGYLDIIVGDMYADMAYVISGQDGSTILHQLTGSQGWAYFGMSVSGLGDIDGDGCDDFVVGAPYGNSSMGYADIFSGQSGKVLYTYFGSNGYYAGYSVDCAGDVNGDGVPDIIIGAPYGYCYSPNQGYYDYFGMGTVVSGADGSTLYDCPGDYSWNYFGYAVAGVGDVDGDGYDDVAVGGYNDPNPSYVYTGRVVLYSGIDGSQINTLYGTRDYEYFGCAIAPAGDLDGDGLDDVLVGAFYAYNSNGQQTGAAYAFSMDGTKIAEVYGPSTYEYFGYSVAGLEDVNQDGMQDMAVGQYYGLSGYGQVFVYVTPSPKGSVLINDGDLATADPEASLDITWAAGEATVSEMRLRNAGEDWGPWVGLKANMQWTLTAGEELKTVEIQFRDSAGLSSKVTSDTIYFDATAPSGTISVEGGAAWTNKSTVTINCTFSDNMSGVAQVRARAEGGTWSAWSTNTSRVDVPMPSGDGPKTFQAEARDWAMNVSSLASDDIGLDTVAPPSGSIQIDDGYPYSPDWSVKVDLTAADNPGGSGIDVVKFRRLGDTAYGPWEPFVEQQVRVLPSGEGAKGYYVIFRDRAGNESREFFDGILVDMSAPSIFQLSVMGRYAFFVAGETLYIRTFAADNAEGSGISEMRATFDNGVTYSPWVVYDAVRTPLVSPSGSGFYQLRVQVRDNAGNTSALSTVSASVFLVETTPPHLGMAGTYTGYLSNAQDSDSVTFDLIAGDVVKITGTGRAATRGQAFPLTLQMLTPSGMFIDVTSGATFNIPSGGTGRYLLQASQGGGPGSYKISVAVKRPKATTAFDRTLRVKSDGLVEFVFQGTDGCLFSAHLEGGEADPATFFLLGPDGAVPFELTGGKGSFDVMARFGQGVGLYRLGVAATGTVKVTFTSTPPRKSKMMEP